MSRDVRVKLLSITQNKIPYSLTSTWLLAFYKSIIFLSGTMTMDRRKDIRDTPKTPKKIIKYFIVPTFMSRKLNLNDKGWWYIS